MPVAEMTIGEFIASARADRKLSLRAFAQYIGTSQTAVSDWEKGNRVPDPESCRKLARYLHMPEEEVLRMAGHMAPAEESKPEPLIIPAIASRLSGMTPEEQRRFALPAIRVVEELLRSERERESR